jgi:lipid-A-disaccharide synthase
MMSRSPSRKRTIFFSVGEPSGDLHGANLIRALKEREPNLECVGYGGPLMQQAGCRLHTDLTALAVMFILRVILNLHVFIRLLRDAHRFFRQQRPDAVVLIDYPGFNWWIARLAKARGIPVFYYGVPQMWGWLPWRVRKMRKLVDHALCKLPFEEAWFRQRGCHATYVGHPYFDQMRQQLLDRDFLEDQEVLSGPLVAILPGSRAQEVTNNLPTFLRAARLIRERVPSVRFAIASFNDRQAALARAEVARHGLPMEVYVGRTPELIHLSRCCLACSGSVSLELLYHVKPAVILYKVSRWLYLVARYVLARCKYITLVNLLAAEDRFDVRGRRTYDPQAPGAEHVPYPEYPTYQDVSGQLAQHIIEWLAKPEKLSSRVALLERLKAQLCHSGASSTAADYILRVLAANQLPLHAPHFPAKRQANV